MQQMRRSLLLLCLSCLMSCTPQPPALSGRPHFWRPPPQTGDSSTGWLSGDTLVCVCAVGYPEGYDWFADSTGLREGCRILVWANGEQVLSLDTGTASGLSPDGDTHHLAEGHLLSEGFRNGETLLLRDGEMLIHFAGREKLCGYLYSEGRHYSLWRDRDGTGFTLRKDDIVLQRRENGRPIGDFGDADRRGGALSLAGGTACFAYTLKLGDETACFLSLGGSEILLHKGSGVRFLDARLLDGRTWTLYDDSQGKTRLSDGMTTHDFSMKGILLWQEARIVEWEGGPAVLGSTLIRGQTTMLNLLYSQSGELRICTEGICIPTGRGNETVLCYDSGRRLTLFPWLGTGGSVEKQILWDSGEGVYFPSGACVSSLGERICIGVSPLGGGKPYLWAGRKLGEWALNGYICAVEALLSPPNGGS